MGPPGLSTTWTLSLKDSRARRSRVLWWQRVMSCRASPAPHRFPKAVEAAQYLQHRHQRNAGEGLPGCNPQK